MRVLRLLGEIQDQVEGLKYLGASPPWWKWLYRWRHKTESGAMRWMFWAVRRGFINRMEVSKETKVVVYTSAVLLILPHSSESWTLTIKHRSQIQSMEMRHLWKVQGKTRQDRIQSDTIRINLHAKPYKLSIQPKRQTTQTVDKD